MSQIFIGIDLSEVVEEFALTQQQGHDLATSLIDKITESAYRRWEDLVDKELHQTRGEYKRAMYVERTSPTEVVFGLTDRQSKLPLAIEEGSDSFDMKESFERSSKKKMKRDGGWFLTVPFRHATPGAVATAGAFASVLPKDVYQIAKNNAGKPVQKSQLPTQHQALGVRQELLNKLGVKIPAYTHKAAKYEGVVRKDISSTSNEVRGGYFTFRRVSDKSDPTSWIHKGFKARDFMGRSISQNEISSVVDRTTDEFLNKLK